jgi:hypothetical protein
MLEYLKRLSGALKSDKGPIPVVARSNVSTLTDEVRDALDATMISVRDPDENGPRVAVISRSLRGAFVFSRDEAARRIRLGFPELSDQAVARAVQHLANRVTLALRPRVQAARKKNSWVHGWKEETGEGFR